MLLISLSILLSACGPLTTNSTPSLSVSPRETLYILDGYTNNGTPPQQIIGIQPDAANTARTTLPAGLISADHKRIYTATPQNGHTNITITNTQTNAVIIGLSIDGNYSTADQNYTKSVISFDGHWLALRQQGTNSNDSVIALIDTQTGKQVKIIHLQGNFDLDALSPDGNNLYLLERLNDTTGHYKVRLYQVDRNELFPAAIADKGDVDTRMIGSALTRQMAPDGSVAYTLYTDTQRNLAFVHLLFLGEGANLPFARCVFLPTGKSAALLRYYTLTLAPNGGALYAANAALGVVSVLTNIDTPSADIADKIRFEPGQTTGANTTSFHNGAAISADGQMLYFLGPRGVWTFNTSEPEIKGNYATQQSFTDIALSADGQTLYAVHPTSGITMIQAGSGQTQQITQSVVHAPWGIAWVTN